jgi:arginase
MLHFCSMHSTFLMSSRLGLLHKPIGQTEANIGVENAPAQVISEGISNDLGLEPYSFTYSSPEEINSEQYYSIFADEAQQAKQLVSRTLQKESKTQPSSILIGGDHSVSLAHVAALLDTIADPKTTAIIMMDSHGDLNLRATSPTGNIHGMWMRPIVDTFDVAEINQVVSSKVPAQNLCYIGNLDLDIAEQDFIKQHKITVLPVNNLHENKQDSLKIFHKFISNFTHIHLSIDVDGFDQSIAPATGIPCKNGLFFEDVQEFLQTIKHCSSWSMDIVEVNPQKSGAEQTIQFAQKLLRFML